MRGLLGLLAALALLGLLSGVAILIARWLFPLPGIAGRPEARSLPADPSAPLVQIFIAEASAHPGRSGVVPLADGHEALATRLGLTALAVRSIDAQYYIWQDDTTGILLLEALRAAAGRGVRVRLLLDDNGVPGMDGILATLNALPGFEVRLFNPSTVRRPKYLGYAFDFFRMNRRMHNKSFIADGAAAIVGGRNIGDEYFALGENSYFDLDVLTAGPVVATASTVFDSYWNSASVFALESVVSDAPDPAAFAARVEAARVSPAMAVLRAAFDMDAGNRAAEAPARMEWTAVRLLADDPAKGLGMARRNQLMIGQLIEMTGAVEARLDIASAYFVPGPGGMRYLAGLARHGRRIRILTNALATTDVLLVHAGYSRYRRDLLQAGIQLYELKALVPGSGRPDPSLAPLGLSGSSLHAKTFAIDGRRVFVGSFNFDPRSATLNCEMGVLIDSPQLAKAVSGGFGTRMEQSAYQPKLTPEGRMVWVETRPDGSRTIYQQEPGTGWLRQVAIAVIALLPIEWLL